MWMTTGFSRLPDGTDMMAACSEENCDDPSVATKRLVCAISRAVKKASARNVTLRAGRQSLEDVFLRLTRTAAEADAALAAERATEGGGRRARRSRRGAAR